VVRILIGTFSNFAPKREEMKKIAALTLSLFLTCGIALADTPKDADAQPAKPGAPAKPKAANKADKSDSAIAAEIEELRQTLQAQQEQLSLLKEELAKRDRQIDEAREAAAAANARASEASSKATEAANTTAEVTATAVSLNSSVSDLKASNAALKSAVASEQAEAKKVMEDGPATIHYKGITFTPGGSSRRNPYSASARPSRYHTLTGIPFRQRPQQGFLEFNASGRPSPDRPLFGRQRPTA
jgi:FKBP-type peptidyl-prolyl cis-trans isomerase